MTIRISDEFIEVTTKTVDERQRISLGEEIKGIKRVKLFKSPTGTLLLLPLVEVPLEEAWLYKNKKALASIRKGLKEAAEGKISKLNLKKL